MRALLFDLDGTLTRSAGAGTRALGKALHARPQATAELRKMRLDGMTDRAIARIVLAAERDQGRPIEERMREVAESEIDAVGNDLDFRSSTAAPTIRFAELVVSGA